jgi:hypothetical protein
MAKATLNQKITTDMKIYMQKQANMIQEDKIVCIHEFRDAPSAKSF